MQIIRKVIETLNRIDVRGADNLDRMLACIQTLERFDAALEQKEAQHDDQNEQKEDVSSPVG